MEKLLFLCFVLLTSYFIFEKGLKKKSTLSTKENTLAFFNEQNYHCYKLSKADFKKLIKKKDSYYTSKLYNLSTFDKFGNEVIDKIDFNGDDENNINFQCLLAAENSNLYLCKNMHSENDWFFLIFKKYPVKFVPCD